MSTKALYQTLYQTEHLFRVPTESLADWGENVPQPVEPVAVVAPVVPPVRLPEVPQLIEPAVEPTESPLVDLILPDQTPDVAPLLAEYADKAVEDLIAEALLDTGEMIETPALPEKDIVLQDTRPPAHTLEARKPEQLKHKVLLLADEDLTPSDLLFLEKILKAVNLDVNGVDLLNVYGVADVDFQQVLSHKYINHFITFGVPFRRINLDIMMDRYQPIRFDGITFLMVDSLPVIEANQTLKRMLWNSLKRVFEIGN